MAAVTAYADYDHRQRPSARPRPSNSNLRASVNSPRSPHTPMLGRSISSQYGSPSAFRAEQEDVLIYELDQRYFSAGFAGESKPRCIIPFTPDAGRRVGDFRPYHPDYKQNSRHFRLREKWAAGYYLYKRDCRKTDLGLMEDMLERAFRTAQTDYLQVDSKPRKVVLIVPSLCPAPYISVALKIIFAHWTQPPSVSLLSNTIMCCVSAGLRNALVIDVGWQETVVTAIGEYKEVAQRRSVRAGRNLTKEMRNIIEGSVPSEDEVKVTFEEAEDITQRMAWCQPRITDDSEEPTLVQLPVPGGQPTEKFSLLFEKLAEPAETVLFASGTKSADHDDHELPIHLLAHQLLLSLPVDLRSLCISRIVLTGSYGNLPGLKKRLLQELQHLSSERGWDVVCNYGSAKERITPALKDRSPNVANVHSGLETVTSPDIQLSPYNKPIQDSTPTMARVHDDIKDPITLKAEKEQAKGRHEAVKGIIRGVESLGAWAGASLVASLRVKGAHEVEREDFLKNGLKDQGDGV
ncbi:uncharacterized protein MYCFIDRAFT_136237 [Pseudocercospora fijiensis CIRAD86]|uniref:Actin-like ATPase domain-containing protein n=1 Tax=Pseudocercospora fijiensis (strain CIRAD86) TaxID=383855 RepID=M2ZUL3_PSEFD|nr:uncharacterized protein MYCFIDRAFT_136237 [Pseudocercospora fijiensis CIRAD86]EME82694.1 hypothetical protein MYCFIDRAFT_136237 [Pseudocercospora fijiensis CIRAD86]